MSTATFKQLPNGQWAIKILTQASEDYDTCSLDPQTPVTVHKADGSIVEAKCGRHLGHHLYGGDMSCLYAIEGRSRPVKPAPSVPSLRDIWDESR